VKDDGEGVRGAKWNRTDAKPGRRTRRSESARAHAGERERRGSARVGEGERRKGACARRTCVRMPRPGVLRS